MIHKLSNKFKIILAVAAVVAVAAGAVAIAATLSNSNDLQNALNDGANQGISLLANDEVVIMSDSDVAWSKTLDEAKESMIGRYETYYDGGTIDVDIVSEISVPNGLSVRGVEIEGVTFEGDEITNIYGWVEGDIILSQAGIYTAVVTTSDDVSHTFYAQVGKKQLNPTTIDLGEEKKFETYSGENIGFTVASCIPLISNLPDVIDVNNISTSGRDFYGNSISIEQDEEFDEYSLLYVVRDAGEYEISLTIFDEMRCNYEWKNNPDSATDKAVFTVNQALVAGSASMHDANYTSDLTADVLTSQIQFSPSIAANNDQSGKYSLEFKLYDAEIYTDEHLVTTFSVGQRIYAKAVNILPATSGDTAYRNYRLPEQGEEGFDGITVNFALQSPPLPALNITTHYYEHHPEEITFPSNDTKVSMDGNAISATYLNFGYKISQWFYGDSDVWGVSISQYGHERGIYWNVEVTKIGLDGKQEYKQTVDPDSFEMKDAGTYRIKITAKEGFRFTVSEYNYTLTISQFILDDYYVNWIDNKHEYTGQEVPLGDEDYDLDLPGLLSADNEKLILQVKQIDSNGNVIDEIPARAGVYRYQVVGIQGTVAANYKLPQYPVTNDTHEFIIYRKMLSDFSGTQLITGTFDGTLQSQSLDEKLLALNLGFYSDEGIFVPYFQLDENNIKLVRSYPQSWNLGSATFQDDAVIGYDLDSKLLQFKFTHAGSYSLTIIATEMFNNYCWYGGDNRPLSMWEGRPSSDPTQYTWENFALIERSAVDPSFGSTNFAVNDEYFDIDGYITTKFAGITYDGAAYQLMFGVDNAAPTGDRVDWDSTNSKYIEGNYYVTISLSDNLYPDCYFVGTEGITVSENGKKARIDYSVTSNTISIKCQVINGGYTFGDNFASGYGVNNVFTISVTNGSKVGDPTYKFYTDEQCLTLVAEANLINGLPRNVGKYYVVISVNYVFTPEGGEAENGEWISPRPYELNVAKRQIDSFVWTLDGTMTSDLSKDLTYDGSTHTVSVQAHLDQAYLPAVNVVLSGASATNADSHVFNIVSLDGDEADNYTYDGLTNTSFTLNIAKAAITVTANNFENITFGEGLTLSGDEYVISAASNELKALFTALHNANLSVAVYIETSGQLSLVTDYSSLEGGSYFVVPIYQGISVPGSLNNKTYVISTLENYTVTMVADDFGVVAKTLEITLYGGSSSVYGETINLYVPYADGHGIYSIDIDLKGQDVQDIVAISLTTKSGQAVNMNGRVAVGEYRLKAALTTEGAKNYEIKIKYASGSVSTTIYTVTPLEITLKAKEVLNHSYGNQYDSAHYGGYEITSGELLDGDNISATLTMWSYENLEWKNFSSGVVQTRAVGEYYQLPRANGVDVANDMQEDEDGRFYYCKTVGNYKVTAYAEKFVIVPRAITLTFVNNAAATYGDAINLWKQQGNLSDSVKRYTYTYFTGGNLPIYPNQDTLADIINVALVDGQGNEYNPSSVRLNAATYSFKATVKNDNYAIADGDNKVNVFVGGQFVVNPKSVNVTVMANKTSITYGDTLADAGITLGCTVAGNALLSGDSLGETAGIYSSDDTAITDISKQNVGTNYYLGVTWTNANYVVTFNKVGFTIVKRAVTVTAGNSNTHVYGNSFDLSSIQSNWTAATTNGHGDAIVSGDNLDISASVYNGTTKVTDFTKLTVKDGGYAIKLAKGANANANYDVNFADGTFTVNKRQITITPDDVTDHVYGSALKADELTKTITTSNGTGNAIVNGDDLSIALKVYNGATDVTATVAGLAVNTYTIKVVYVENNNYSVTTDTADFTVIKLKATITFNPSASSVYGEAVNLKNAYSIAGLHVTDTEEVTAKLNGTGVEASSTSPVGTYTVVVTIDDNYEIKYVNADANNHGTYTITKRAVTVTAINVTSHTYGESYNVSNINYNVAVTNGTGNAIVGSDNLDIVKEVYDGETKVNDISKLNVKSGGYTIKLTKGASSNTNYDITLVGGKFTVVQRVVTLSFGNGGTSVYGNNDVDLYKAVSSNQGLLATDNIKDVVTLTAKNASNVSATSNYAPAGSYTVTAAIASAYSVNYKLADGTSTGVYQITKRQITLTADDKTITYGDSFNSGSLTGAFALASGTGSALVNGDTLTVTAKVYNGANAVADADVSKLAAGNTYAIKLTCAGGNNYEITNIVDGTLTVNYAEIVIGSVTSGHASGAYTGAAYSLFGTMNATTVNSQAVTWYYREVGQTDSDWKQYNNNTLTNVCNKQFQVKATAANHNDKVYGTTINFEILQNSITIKADDKEITYGDLLSSVTFSGKLQGSANGLLTANLNSYISAAEGTYSVSSYTTTTEAGSELNITSTYIGDDNVRVTVENGTLTVTTRVITVTFTQNGGSSIYGDDVTLNDASVYTYACNFANSDNFSDVITVSAKDTDNVVIAAVKPHAGEYTVIAELANNNYTIKYTDDVVQGKYSITKRVITAALNETSVEYAEDIIDGVINYHGGAYGAAHNAVVNFGNLVEGDTLSINNGCALFYDTTEGNGQVAGAAPTKAGNYQITVTLSNENYTFADDKTSVELGFEVTKKVIDASQLTWNQATIEFDNANQDNYVNGYISAIMQVVSATKITAQQMQEHKSTDLKLGDSETGDCYYIDDDGVLHIVALGRAEYSVTFKLNSDAQDNYKFSNLQASDESVELAFYVITENITLTVNSAGWQYLDKVNDEDIIKVLLNVRINGEIPLYGLSYAYAPVKVDADIEALLQRKAADGYGGFDEKDVSNVFEMLSALDIPRLSDSSFDVGYYVFRVTFDTFDHESEDVFRATKYDIVKVSPKQLNLTTTLESRPYNGAQQRIDIDFNMSSNGTAVSIKDLVTATVGGAEFDYISGRTAGTYTATITIKDTVHYVWADDMNANINGEVTVTWTITKDTANNDNGTYFTVGAIADSIYGGTIIKNNPTAKSGYGSSFTWFFANKGSLTNASDVATWTKWDESNKPVNAGDYFVKVVLTDTSAGQINFTDKVGYGELTIGKATLHITLSGSLEYGNAFAQNYCDYAVVASDLINGDTSSVVRATSGFSYYLVDGNGDQLSNLGKLEFGTYNLTVWTDASNHVIGLTADNYHIVLSEGYGEFKVTAKAITVTINANGASSQYGLEPDLTGVTATYTGVDSDLVIAKVLENLYTEATSASGVGNSYVISSRYDENNENKNLVISYTVAYYTITARKIYVTLDASNAGGTYKGTIGQVTVSTVKDENGVDISALIGADYLTVVYGGTAFDGTAYAGDDTHAGNSFTATVEGDADNDNFEIVDAPEVSFAVNKIVVDSGKITAENQMYTGEGLDPIIIDKDYNVNGKKIYNVNYDKSVLVDVKTHDLTLELVDAYNYAWNSLDNESATAIIKFVIAGAGIYAIPYAEIVYYGATYSDIKLALKYKLVYASGVNKGEDATADVKAVGDGVKFVFVDKESLNLDLNKLAAGKYNITLETVNGFVVGLESTNSNYSNIALELNSDKQIVYGVLEVKPRRIAITVNDSSSVYSEAIDVTDNGFEVTDGDLVFGEGKEVINFNITANTSSWINVGNNYAVTATATASNYDIVNVISGTHTITALKLSVTISAKDGKYIDKAVEVTTTQSGNVSYDFGANFANKYKFKYTGSNYESNSKPVNAGTYTVTIEAIDDTNFELVSVTNATFTIAKATLTLTPSGTLTYGERFETGAFTYTITGFKGNDDESVITKTSEVVYKTVEDGVKLVVNKQGYALTVGLENGFVKGLTADNYNIEVSSGILTINKRPITITVNDSSSVYSEAIDVTSNGFEVTDGELVSGDGKDVIDFRITADTHSWLNVGNNYKITATATANNYEIVEVVSGTHTITPIKLSIVIHAIDGTYGDDKNVARIDFMSVEAIHSDGTREEVDNLKFSIRYAGTANDMSTFDEVDKVPTKAGVYRVTVVDVLNDNYVLDVSDSIYRTTLDIFKRPIDSEKITATSQAYTGKAIIPTIEDTLYNVGGAKVYNTIFQGSLINVGTYDLTLSLIDIYNNEWVDNLNRTTTIKFEIVKAENRLVDVNNPSAPADSVKVVISDWTFGGEAIEPIASVVSGENNIVFEYATSQHGTYTTEVPKDAGEYWVRATVAASNNYNAFVSNATKFVISKKVVSLPIATNLNGNSVYTGSMLSLAIDGFDDQIMSLTLDNGMYRADNDGKLNLLVLNAKTYKATFKLRNTNNYAWADDSKLVNGEVVVSWTVERQVVKRLPDASNKIIVNGDDIVFMPEGFNSGIMTIEGNVHAHEGSYNAIVTLKDTENYVWEGTDSPAISVKFELAGTNVAFIASICVVAGLCVGLAVMAVILTLVNRSKKRKQAKAIDERSRAEGWEGQE